MTLQVPDPHDSLARGREHPVKQAEQWVLVFKRCSHPLRGFPSQSPQPGSQLAIMHVPLEQSPVPFRIVQPTPQPPQ